MSASVVPMVLAARWTTPEDWAICSSVAMLITLARFTEPYWSETTGSTWIEAFATYVLGARNTYARDAAKPRMIGRRNTTGRRLTRPTTSANVRAGAALSSMAVLITSSVRPCWALVLSAGAPPSVWAGATATRPASQSPNPFGGVLTPTARRSTVTPPTRQPGLPRAHGPPPARPPPPPPGGFSPAARPPGGGAGATLAGGARAPGGGAGPRGACRACRACRAWSGRAPPALGGVAPAGGHAPLPRDRR